MYLNPLYGTAIWQWAERLVEQYRADNVTESITLFPSRTDTKWIGKLREFPRCFLRGQIKFLNSKNSAPFPSCVVYLGLNINRFVEVFSRLGDIFQIYQEQETTR